ncbi:hypothetical protein E8E13_006365 [Curvularia kusanoi]|uniref:Homeobox domain-containing protein n=1 Tax=Curvularia kusanoi TaxID=90978 RepID=A0A9P4TC55_CURKU|nr:hypothetical protein E8E13_006365 [Curvularia kusanoi]
MDSLDPSMQHPYTANGNDLPPDSAAAGPKPGGDVKPRLTKDQHDILEQHFQQQHKPTTGVKKAFADRLGVPLDKINNWFQNRRAKVKQDRKKAMNQYNMQLGMGMYGQQVPVMAGQHFAGPPHPEMYQQQQQQQQQHQPHPQHQQLPQHQPHMAIPQEFGPVTADISPASLPVQGADRPSALDLGPQNQLQQPFDMHQYNLRTISEADRSTSYPPQMMMHSALMAATAGPSYMQQSMPTNSQDQAFSYNSSYANPITFSMPSTLPAESALSQDDLSGFADYGNIDYSTMATAQNDHPRQPEAQNSTSTGSNGQSPYSGNQSATNSQSSNGPTPPVASITSMYSGWKEDPDSEAQLDHANDNHDFAATFNFDQNTPSESTLPFWDPNGSVPSFQQHNFYQQLNTSSQAILSSPGQDLTRKHSAAASDFEVPQLFGGDDAFRRRNSSTSNLAHNMDAVHIRNGTPDDFKQLTQTSSIAIRRQKRPAALNSNAMRSASYTPGMPSPAGNPDHTLRRIRSTGIANGGGRVQKSRPGSAQPSPMVSSFSEAAGSPRIARTFSSSSATTLGNNGSLAPPTPLTPQEMGFYWQPPGSVRANGLPDHNSPESFNANWSAEPLATGLNVKSGSPPSTPLDLQRLNQARLAHENIYRDTPPQSAPPTQQNFPRSGYMQPPQMRAGYHSSTDLTLSQPKPSHFRRPSLPADSAQNSTDEVNLEYPYGGSFGYNEISLQGISHNVPFAPPVSSMPEFLVHQYTPSQGATDMHGNTIRRMDQPKSYVFANQSASDFRS